MMSEALASPRSLTVKREKSLPEAVIHSMFCHKTGMCHMLS